MTRYRIALGLLALLAASVCAADVYLLPAIFMPAVAYMVPVLLSAYLMPRPRWVAAVALWTLLLQIMAYLLQDLQVTLLPVSYVGGLSMVSLLCVVLSDRARREAELRSRLESIVQQMPSGVVIAEAPSGKLIQANRQAEQIWGVDSVSATSIAEYGRYFGSRPSGQPFTLKEIPLVRSLRAGEQVRNEESVIVRGDGTSAIVSASSAPIRDALGRITAAVLVLSDITERKQAELERERLLGEVEGQRQLFQTVIDNTPAGIAVLRGPNFVFEVVNPVYQAIASGKVFVGRSVAETWPEVADQVMPLLEGVLRTGEPFHATDLPMRIRRASGGPLEEVHFSFSYVPLPRVAEDEVRILVLVHETTEQVLARQQVVELARTAERRAAELQSVLDNMVDGVYVCDLEGRVTLANEAGMRILGLAKVEEVKRQLAEFPVQFSMRHPEGGAIAPGDLPLARALAGEVVMLEDEIVFNPQTRRDVYLRASAAPIKDASGKVVAAVEVARDMTDLIEFERQKDDFIKVAAHELKTPVAIMKGYAQAILRRAGEVPPERRRMLEAIDDGANRIDRIVNDLLDITRLHLGHLELSRERIDLGQLVEQVVDQRALTTTNHRLRVARAEPVVLQGDRDRLEQVVVNLVDNALRYSPKGGDIDVEVAVREGEVVVSVSDRGVGIPKEKQPLIFQRFHRAHTGTPYDYGGMGVGLYISREIVARHGGRMWFESEEGRGSTFFFALPPGGGDGRE